MSQTRCRQKHIEDSLWGTGEVLLHTVKQRSQLYSESMAMDKPCTRGNRFNTCRNCQQCWGLLKGYGHQDNDVK